MSSFRRERRDALPLTWEPPAVATCAWVAVAATLLPAGRGAATWLTGAGWAWPENRAGLRASLAGLLTGHPAAGLTTADVSGLPASSVVYLVVVLAEVAWLMVSVLAVGIWWRTWGPGMRQGLADRFEVEKVLGLSRIRHDRRVIRPDLHGKPRTIGGRS